MSMQALSASLRAVLKKGQPLPVEEGSPVATGMGKTDALKKLNEVGAALTKAMQEVQGAAGETLPAGFGGMMKKLADALSGLAVEGQGHDAGGNVATNQPDVVKPNGENLPAAAGGLQKRARVGKALDAYTEKQVTMQAAQCRMWAAMDLMREGKDAEAGTELQGVMDMLKNVTQGASTEMATNETPAAPEKRDVSFTQKSLEAYAAAELSKAMKEAETDDHKASKRLQHLQKLLHIAKGDNWSGTMEAPVLEVEILSVYAPDAVGAVEDLTVTKDQERTTEPTPGKDQPMATQIAENVVKALGGVSDKLDEFFGKDLLPAPPEDDGTVWPRDMNSTLLADDKKAVTKLEEDSWGRDSSRTARGRLPPWRARRFGRGR